MQNINAKKTVGLIGCGNMGRAILAQALKRRANNFIIFEKNKARQTLAAKAYHIKACRTTGDLVRKSNIIIIAVKPQDIDGVLGDLSGLLRLYRKKEVLIISIAAAITTAYIENKISGKVRVVRAMPNMASAIGKGITAFVEGRYVKAKDLKATKAIFECLGPVVHIKNEELINAVTALSGSGPAYLFYIFNAILKVAQELGLDRKTSLALIYQTIIGSMSLLSCNRFDAESLISKVVSKGGTTEAALKVFYLRRLDKILREAVISAYRRAEELSG